MPCTQLMFIDELANCALHEILVTRNDLLAVDDRISVSHVLAVSSL